MMRFYLVAFNGIYDAALRANKDNFAAPDDQSIIFFREMKRQKQYDSEMYERLACRSVYIYIYILQNGILKMLEGSQF